MVQPPSKGVVGSRRYSQPCEPAIIIASADGIMAVANKKTGEVLRYSISDEWLPKILAWLKSDPLARYDGAMSAEEMFQVERVEVRPPQ